MGESKDGGSAKRKVTFWFESGAGSRETETFEIDDDASDDDIQETLEDWMGNYFSAGWYDDEAGK